MGTGCSGGPANAPIIVCFLLIAVCTPLVKSECRVQLCSRQYTSAMDEENVAQGSNYRYCSLLRSYANCVRATGRSCRGDLAYHTVQSLIAKWTRTYACETVIERGPQSGGSNGRGGNNNNNNQHRRPPRPHHECANYRVAGDSFSHCALFGDPHLRTFYDELQTCGVPGAWPLLDNPHLAVQVTNEHVGKGSTATAITKLKSIMDDYNRESGVNLNATEGKKPEKSADVKEHGKGPITSCGNDDNQESQKLKEQMRESKVVREDSVEFNVLEEKYFRKWMEITKRKYSFQYSRYRKEHNRNPLKWKDSEFSEASQGLEVKAIRRWVRIEEMYEKLKEHFLGKYKSHLQNRTGESAELIFTQKQMHYFQKIKKLKKNRGDYPTWTKLALAKKFA